MTDRFRLTNTRALQLFQLLRQGGLILIAVALAKSYLSETEVGAYEMLTYVAYLLTFFWVSGAMQALLSYYPGRSKEEQGQLLVHSFGLFSLLSGGVALLIWLFPSPVLELLVQRSSLPYLSFFLLFVATNIPASLQEHFYLLADRARAIVYYGGLSATAQLLAVALPPLLGQDFSLSFQLLALVAVFKWLWLLLYVVRHGRWQWRPQLLQGWWILAWPLGLYALLGAINISVGPWMVSYFYEGDQAQFAIYRYGARELPLLSALTGALSSALIPAIAATLSTGLMQLRKETSQLQHLLFPLTIILLLTAPYWFTLVFSDKYAAAVSLFQTFLLLTPAHLIFARTILVARQDTQWIPLLAAVGIVLHVSACLLLAPHFGLRGIAIGSVLAFSAEKLILILFVKKKHGLSWLAYTEWRWWLGYSLALLLAYGWSW